MSHSVSFAALRARFDVATEALADLLYSSAATLDGSMSAASACLPAAEEVLHRYVRGT